MAQNEAAWISLHLPVLLNAKIDGVVVVDGGSQDGTTEVAESLGATVLHRAWDWRPLDQENYVIEMMESLGYDVILLTAPDEVWFAEDVQAMRTLMESNQHFALAFPTYNFVKDRLHYAPQHPFYPDVHTRVWRLGQGVRHVKALDSVPNIPTGVVTYCGFAHMYHFSHIKPRPYYELKGLNFHRVKDGLPPLNRLPDEHIVSDYPYHIPFVGKQPLDPCVIGVRAPYENEV